MPLHTSHVIWDRVTSLKDMLITANELGALP